MAVDELEDVIRHEIVREGPIPFARFMALALYHPTLGYYAGGGEGREPIGWAGDFFTSGDVHPLWGWTIARQLHQMWQLLGHPERFDIVEPGAGRGLLARDVWRYVLTTDRAWAAALRYTLVDRAASGSPLRAAREQRLHEELAALGAPTEATRWLPELPAEPIIGCIVANELVDALPVHVVVALAGELHEVNVGLDPQSGRFTEALAEPLAPEVMDYLDAYRIPWRDYPDGWRAEVCLDAIPWLRGVAATLQRGFALTIDYGDTARRLYVRDRYRGTLMAYSRHHLADNPLAQPGMQDLTAHVNFSALVEAGRASGLRRAGLTTQGAFLQRLGIREEAEALGARLYPYADSERHTDRGQADHLRRLSLRGAISTLLDPRGLGGFHVLIQQRGVPGASLALRGLAS
jgi:SAM-dependent MidA family methyltransferase